jgi:Arc/MetJ-type ribon-helix-helix transcriptional regulator
MWLVVGRMSLRESCHGDHPELRLNDRLFSAQDSKMVTEPIRLNPEMRRIVDSLILDGSFADREAVVEATLKLMAEWSAEGDSRTLAELAQEGIDDIRASRFVELNGEEETRQHIRGIGKRVNSRQKEAVR